MKIKLPKAIKGFSFSRLYSFEMNNFEVEALLPALFYLIRTGGKRRGRLVDATVIDARRDSLANHNKLTGFDDSEGKRSLDKWIRTSFIATAARGRGHRKGEQIFYIRPLSFLSYKPGFPAEGRRVRGVPLFLYHILSEGLEDEPAWSPTHGLRYLRDAFTEGLVLDSAATYSGRYDEHTPLDIETVGLLYYLDGFENCPPSATQARKPPPAALERSANRIVEDVRRLVSVYHGRVPDRTLAQFLTGLLNFEMFVYTLELQHVVNRLVDDGEVEPWWNSGQDDMPSPVRFYVNLVGDRRHQSARMAQEQVEAHFAGVQRFCRNNLLLRTLHRYWQTSNSIALQTPRTGEDYMWLLRQRNQPITIARAGVELEQIRLENGIEELEQMPEDFAAIWNAPAEDDFERIMHVLEEAQRSRNVSDMLSWYRSVGGLVRSDGILQGNLRGRRAWRLHMSEGLLEILVQLCCITPGYADVKADTDHHLANLRPRPVSLTDFLRFLEERYGIIVDRPPDWMGSVENVAAAKENFEALKRRLRQMGVFEDLSDDFNAQYIEPRYADEREAEPQEPVREVSRRD
jgi:hypothetical protein